MAGTKSQTLVMEDKKASRASLVPIRCREHGPPDRWRFKIHSLQCLVHLVLSVSRSLKQFDLWLNYTTTATLRASKFCEVMNVYLMNMNFLFYFFILQWWKLVEAYQMLKAIVSGNGCHIKVTFNCQSMSDFDRVMLVSVPVWVQIHST